MGNLVVKKSRQQLAAERQAQAQQAAVEVQRDPSYHHALNFPSQQTVSPVPVPPLYPPMHYGVHHPVSVVGMSHDFIVLVLSVL